MELDGLYKIEFGALEGATVKLKGKTTEGMEIQVLFIIQPDGTVVPFDDGTHQLYVRPKKVDLADFKYKLKVKQPKGAVFRLED